MKSKGKSQGFAFVLGKSIKINGGFEEKSW